VIIVIIVLINACDKYSGLLFQINMIIVAGRVCVCVPHARAVQREFSSRLSSLFEATAKKHRL